MLDHALAQVNTLLDLILAFLEKDEGNRLTVLSEEPDPGGANIFPTSCPGTGWVLRL